MNSGIKFSMKQIFQSKGKEYNCSNCITGRLTAEFCQGTCPAFCPSKAKCLNYYYKKGDELKASKVASVYNIHYIKKEC